MYKKFEDLITLSILLGILSGTLLLYDVFYRSVYALIGAAVAVLLIILVNIAMIHKNKKRKKAIKKMESRIKTELVNYYTHELRKKQHEIDELKTEKENLVKAAMKSSERAVDLKKLLDAKVRSAIENEKKSARRAESKSQGTKVTQVTRVVETKKVSKSPEKSRDEPFVEVLTDGPKGGKGPDLDKIFKVVYEKDEDERPKKK